jgi:hypothetical protein
MIQRKRAIIVSTSDAVNITSAKGEAPGHTAAAAMQQISDWLEKLDMSERAEDFC